MTIVDGYIRTREKLLDLFSGVQPNIIMNPKRGPDNSSLADLNLASEIKQTMNQFKALAMDESGSRVNYQELSADPLYQRYTDLVSHLRNYDYQLLSTNQERLVFWINLYNTLVIDAVIQEGVQNSVVESRLGILSFFQKAAYLINGQRFSLSDIEHGVIRGNRGFPYFPGPHFSTRDPRIKAVISQVDPRIHFALNCASKSCPAIGVYSPEGLESQLDLAVRNFIQNDLTLNKDQKKITISQIFRWYQVDFGSKREILHFLIKHSSDPGVREWLEKNLDSIRIKYHRYDWGLNQVLQ